jgi:hypothetical protein
MYIFHCLYCLDPGSLNQVLTPEISDYLNGIEFEMIEEEKEKEKAPSQDKDQQYPCIISSLIPRLQDR